MLHCNCSFNICVRCIILLFKKQRVKEEWMRPWKIRSSWNIKENSISGAFVLDCTIRFRIFHLDHCQLLLNGYRAKLLMTGKERKRSEKDDRSASHTRDFEMNFSITIFFCKKLEMPDQGIGTLEENGCWLFVWFTRRDSLI